MSIVPSTGYSPNHLSPAYNPIIWSVLSSESSYTNMRYVFDIYLDADATKTVRIKQRPNPAGYGMLDISSIIQSYLDYSEPTAAITNGETTIDYASGKIYQSNPFLSRSVTIKVGEELDGIIYTGSGSVGEPSYILYSGNTTDSKLAVKVWPASLSDHEQQWHMQKVTASGVFGGNPFMRDSIGAIKNFDFGIGLSYPLSFDSLHRSVYTFDKCTLSFINFTPYLEPEFRRIYGFRILIKDSSANTVHTEDVPMITANGYAQRALSTTANPSTASQYDIVHVLASPNDLLEAIGETNNHPLSAGMQIWITGHKQASVGSATFGAAITQTIKLTIKEYCSDPLYQRVRLSWLNTLGGRDYLNFTAFTEKTISTKSEEFFNEQMNWSGQVPVAVNADSYLIGRLGIAGGFKPYNKQVTTVYDIESDWLTQEQVNLLEGLQKSPQVLAYIHDEDNTLSDYYAYTVRIKDSSYSSRNVRQAKLVQGKFKIELVMPQKIQTTY
jgi:hypothetical protein